MNLFRSEEHARRWEEFEPKMAAMLHPVQWWADTFATPMFRARARSDFVSWMSGDEGAAAFAALRERLTPPRPDVVATVAAVAALSQVDLSILDGASPDDRTVEQHLMRAWPTAVPVDEVRQWRHTAAAMIVAIPSDPPPDLDGAMWTGTRRSAVRDVQAADGWLKRAELGAGDMRLTERLRQMGWQGEVADQPAWTAMEQSARAVLQCRHLSLLV